LAWLFLRERQGRARWIGYGAIGAGIACLVAATTWERGMPDPIGIAALLLAAAMWASYTLLFRRSSLQPIQAAALICFWSTLLFLPVYFGLGLSQLGSASASELAVQAIYQGILMSAVAVVTFNRSVALLGPSAATAIIALVPAAASLLAVPLLAELPAMPEAGATLLVVFGVLLSARTGTLRNQLSPA
jgi:drug/metabolite transporter (DMT)-like permease